MLTINTLAEAETFVMLQKARGNDCYFDNYDIVFFRPADQAIYSKHGIFRNGVWGFRNVSEVTDEGKWVIDQRNVHIANRTRN